MFWRPIFTTIFIVLKNYQNIGIIITGDDMINRVKNTISKYNMLEYGDSVVVGVSGGADSVCLLDILNSLKLEYNLKITIVHVNHNIRGEEADSDQKYVESLADKYGVPINVFSYPVEQMAKNEGISSEEMGRKLRYKAFESIADGCAKIAVAHNINDNAETMIMNFFRGTGIKGLTGISPVRGNIIRPLITLSKSEIIEYCKVNNLRYCDDHTNFEDVYTRNKMRLKIIPEINKIFNKDIAYTMLRTSDIMSEEERYLENVANKAYKACLVDAHRLLVDKIKAYDIVIQRRIIRMGFRDFLVDLHDISFDHIESVISLLYGESGRVAELPKGLRASREHDTLYFYVRNTADNKLYYDVPINKKLHIREQGFSMLLADKKMVENCKLVCTIAFDCDKIVEKLTLRSRKTGDRIYINGIGGNKSIKKLFIDDKIHRSKRDSIPMLAMGSDILWIKDYKTSDYFKADENTANKLYLYVEEE